MANSDQENKEIYKINWRIFRKKKAAFFKWLGQLRYLYCLAIVDGVVGIHLVE